MRELAKVGALFLLMLIGRNLDAQVFVTGDKVIGSANTESLIDIKLTSDNGFILFGHGNGSGQDISATHVGGYDFLLIKTDQYGNVIWDRLLGSTSNEFAYAVAEDAVGPGGYVVVGYTEAVTASGDISTSSYGDYSDMWIAKVSADGSTILWEKRIGGNREDYAFNIVQSSDGGYLISSFTNSNSGTGNLGAQPARGNFDALVIKVDDSGNISWTKRFGGNQFENLKVLKETSDGGFVIASQTFTNINGDKTIASLGGQDVWVVKFDASRNIVWQKSLGGTAADEVEDILVENTGNINVLLTTSSNSNVAGSKSENSYGNKDYWLVNLSSTGNLNWDKTYGGSSEDVAAGLAQDSEGNILVTGYSNSNVSGNKTSPGFGDADLWTLKVNNTNGAILWDFTHGGTNSDKPVAITISHDDGIVVGSKTQSGNDGNKTSVNYGNSDFWLVKYFATPFDNTRYAIASANWQDTTTWSLRPGGPACCVPDMNSSVYIDGYDVLLNSDQNVGNLNITNNGNLNIESALFYVYGPQVTIDATSAITEQVSEAKMIFSGNQNTVFTNNSTIGILLDELDMNKDAKLIIDGSGDIHLNNDLDVDLCDSLVFNTTGTITITDDLGVSTSNATIINNSANLVILDDITQTTYANNIFIVNYASIICDDIGFGNKTGRFHNYGNIVNDEILNVSSSNEFHNHDNATWTYNGESIDPDVNLFATYDLNTFRYGRAGDQEVITPQDGYYNIELANSGTKYTTSAVLNIDRDLLILDDAVLNTGSFGTDIDIRDDFASYSSQLDPFIPGSTTVTIESDLTNRIESVHGIRFYNLVVNTSDHFNLKQNDLIIENNLHLIDGLLHTENNARFVISDNATVSGYDVDKYIVGPVQKIGDEPFTFPVGDNGNYRPLSITAPSNVSDAFTVRHRDQNIPAAYPVASNDYVIDNILNCSYWLFSRDTGNSQVVVTASWNGSCAVPDLNDLSIASWDGSQWSDEGNGGTTGNFTSGTISSEDVIQNYQVIALASSSLPPVALNDNYSLNEDSFIQQNVLTNDFDPNGYNLAVNTTLVQDPLNGAILISSNGDFTYTPNSQFYGTDSLIYQICNDAAISKCATAMVHFIINAVNDLPVALNDTFQINEDEILNGNVLVNDSEPESQPMQASISQNPLNGNVNLASNGSFSYTPNSNFFGNDVFEYEVCDDQSPAGCSLARVVITILPLNDPPIAVDDNFNVPQYSFFEGTVMDNDYDIDSNLITAAVFVQPSNGTLQLQPDGEFVYTPNIGFSGSDQFNYRLTDDEGLYDDAVVFLNVIENNAPDVIDQMVNIYRAGEIELCIEATDPEGDQIKLKEIITDAGEIVYADSVNLCFDYIPEFENDIQTVLEVVVCDPWQCSSAYITVRVIQDNTTVYQALSPNNDGKNDTWIIDGIENYPDNEVKIFNRYGDLVYAAHGYNNQEKLWIGNSNQAMVFNKNADLPEGTYFYTISLGNGTKPKSGYVVLNR